MIGWRTMARPYAKAVFNLAKRDDSVSAWDDLLKVSVCLVSHLLFQKWVRDPEIQKSQVLELFSTLLPGQTAFQKSFLRLLIDGGRLKLLPDIQWWYSLFREEYENTVTAKVISTYALTKTQTAKIQEALAKRLAKEVFLESQEDPSLLGGMMIRVGDQVFDGSGRRRLNVLKEQLGGVNA